MGNLVDGDDGLPAEEVGVWTKEKHEQLCGYLNISAPTRRMYLGDRKGGAAYIDLFCGPGRCHVEGTGEFIDGGAVAAWRSSVSKQAPFTRVIIGDSDEVRLRACEKRLTQLGAPVVALYGPATETAFKARQRTPPHGLNFAFLDPYKIEALAFEVIAELAKVKRMDFLIHVSKMDLQRNLAIYMAMDPSPFDVFAPGWRDAVEGDVSQRRARRDIFDYWRDLVSSVGAEPSDDVKLIKGTRGQHLYWLLLAARHDLAKKFWKAIANAGAQGNLGL